jgi:hypothetical protein
MAFMDEEDGYNNNENQRDDFMAQLSFYEKPRIYCLL